MRRKNIHHKLRTLTKKYIKTTDKSKKYHHKMQTCNKVYGNTYADIGEIYTKNVDI